MKGLLIFIVVSVIALFAMSSCSSQKRLQRGIEKHGIKESIGFVINKYPEYFKSKDTTIHDTTVIERLVEVPTIDTTVILSDSSDFWHHYSDSLQISLNKATGELKFKYKQKPIYIHDTITVETVCPQIICPDCDDLKDYTKKGSNFQWWWLIVAGVVLGSFYIWSNRNVKN